MDKPPRDVVGEMNQRIQERWLKAKRNWEFTCGFYDAIDEVARCRTIAGLAPGLKGLLELAQGVDGKTIYQPLRGWDAIAGDIHSVLYGLERWPDIRAALAGGAKVKQVDLVRNLGMDKDRTGYFFYVLCEMGVLAKGKEGRYNVLSLGVEQLDSKCLAQGWPALFDKTLRLPMPEMLTNPPQYID